MHILDYNKCLCIYARLYGLNRNGYNIMYLYIAVAAFAHVIRFCSSGTKKKHIYVDTAAT